MPPAPSSSTSVKEFRKWRRLHGLQLPLHPQQVISWVFLISYTLFIFLTLIPAIHSAAQMPLIIINILIFGLHYVTHLVSLLIDPSDPALLALYSKRPVPEFDKDKFNHVIENGRCHLCNINIISVRTKHCSVCNKCVHIFDHHCKWLNQCIGRRNYLAFIICVVSAILMCLSFITLAVTEMTLYHANHKLLSPWQHPIILSEPNRSLSLIPDFDSLVLSTPSSSSTSGPGRNSTGRSLFIPEPQSDDTSPLHTHGSVQNTSLSYGLIPLRAGRLHLFLFPVAPAVFLVTTGLATLVAMMAAGLLLHLCIFHVYINIHDMTTYEYVRAQRQASEEARREALARPSEEEEDEEERSRCECVDSKGNKVAPTKKESFLRFGNGKSPPNKAEARHRNVVNDASQEQGRPHTIVIEERPEDERPASTIPKLPSIVSHPQDKTTPTQSGLRKLQEHLANIQDQPAS